MAGGRIRALALVGALMIWGLAIACGDASRDLLGGGQGGSALGPAPDFAHPDLDGQVFRLAEKRGQTVIIDFWATWCPPCVFQPPELNTFWERHREGGKYVVIGIEVGGASVEEIRDWAEEHDAVAEYPVLTGADEDLARRFGALGFPALVIVAPDGQIHSVHVGLTTAQELEEQVAAVAVKATPAGGEAS